MSLIQHWKNSLAAKEAGWVATGQMLSAVAGFVSVRLLTELLSPEDYGLLMLLMGLTALALSFSVQPFLQAVMRFHAEVLDPLHSQMLRSETKNAICLMLTCAAALMLAAGWWFGPSSGLPAWIGLVLTGLLLVDTWRSYGISLLNAARRQKPMALWLATEAWARPLVALGFFALYGGNAVIFVVSFMLASFAICAVFYGFVSIDGGHKNENQPAQFNAKPKPELDKFNMSHTADADGSMYSRRKDIKARIWSYALPLFPVAGLGWISAVSDRYIIAGLLDLQTAGLYVAIYAVVSRPYIMVGAFLDVWLRPRLYHAVSAGTRENIWRVIGLWSGLCGGISFVGVVCFVTLHEWVAVIMLAAPYRAASEMMPWIALGYSLIIMSQITTRICYAFERTWLVFWIHVVAAVSTLVVSIPAISMYGFFGAAISVPVYSFVQLVFSIAMATIAANYYKPAVLSEAT